MSDSADCFRSSGEHRITASHLKGTRCNVTEDRSEMMEYQENLSARLEEMRAEHVTLTRSDRIPIAAEIAIERTRIATDLEAEINILEEQLASSRPKFKMQRSSSSTDAEVAGVTVHKLLLSDVSC